MMNHLPPELYLALQRQETEQHLIRQRRRALHIARKRAERDAMELERARRRLAHAIAAHATSARELTALTA
ncbi:hypothetical protein CH267_26560 [Rhodococcus sp. 06-621-2]|nr:hypothetical protein CH267_26560 [Rhodococcus sp. 06-621-2]OZD74283.1 hypothetical protein CH263_01070 [Rhodococcus sp. 06-1059B-a]